MTIKEARKLLPDETKDLIEAQVRFMLNRIGEVPPEDFKAAWEQEHSLHIKEWAIFLFDMYQGKKNEGRQDV